MTGCFLLMKRGCLGDPQALTLEPLGYFLGCPGTSPSLSFCPFFILWHHSSLPTLENFLHQKLNTILISNISAIKIIRSMKLSKTYEKLILKHQVLQHIFQKGSLIKRT